ncbi:MAG: MATE family efflux transporter [Clostridia bacterium]|nr:MATE family efflux transporter [Clostridia bacterium]
MNDRQEEKFIRLTTDPVEKLICRMAVPTIISMMVTAIYNTADTFFVGQLHSNSATGAIGIAFSVMAVLQATGFFFGQGSGNYISRQLGKQRTEDAEVMAVTGVVLAAIAGTILMILGLVFLEPLCVALGATDTILPYACDYLRWILIGAPYMVTSFVLNNQLRFQGSAVNGMIGITSGALLNIALDPLLIFGFGLGVSGAAIATITSQFLSFLLLLIGTRRRGNVHLKLKNVRINGTILLQICKGGFPSLLRQGLAAIASICLNHAARVYGDAAIAAMSVVNRAMGMALSALIGFGQGFQPVCGFNYGAGLFDRVKKGFWFCVKVSSIAIAIFSTIGIVFAPQIIAIFRDDPDVIAFGARALRFQCSTFLLGGFVMVGNMASQTMGKTLQASLMAAARQGFFLIPAALILPRIFGETGVQMALSVSEVLSFLLALPLVIGVLRGLEREKNKQN